MTLEIIVYSGIIIYRNIKGETDMNDYKLNPIAKNKIIGIILMIFALFGFFVIAYRLTYYVYEYDAQYSPVDYGKYNILSYFTVQSNFFAYVYFFFASLSIFGVKKAQKIGFNPAVGALVTVYILVAGITYCAGIPLGMTPPFKWDTPAHSMSSFIQVYYHMIMPPVTLLLWFFPFTSRGISRKCLMYSGVYPFVYSVFSMIRGAYSDPTYYPYPFYNPNFIWELFCKDKPIILPLAYLMILLLLIIGISVFVGITAIIMLIHNKRIINEEKINI